MKALLNFLENTAPTISSPFHWGKNWGRKILAFSAGALFCLYSALLHADAAQSLKRYSQGIQSFSAEFSLSVHSKTGGRPTVSSGKLVFQKPGKFRWEVNNPYPQVMVSDGQKVWIYDPELAQATIKQMDQALGASPAALLAGSEKNLERFEISGPEKFQGLSWFSARPKNQESGFSVSRLGFDANGILNMMELHDHFGQTTLIRFSKFQKNPRLSKEQFQLQLPEGVEVLDETAGR